MGNRRDLVMAAVALAALVALTAGMLWWLEPEEPGAVVPPAAVEPEGP